MDARSTFAMFGDATMMLSILVFLATGTLAFAVMIGVRAREAVRRRAVRVGIDDEENAGRRSLRYSGVDVAHKLIDYATKHYSASDSKDLKMLQHRLIQAGIYNPRAAAYFFFARLSLALGLAVARSSWCRCSTSAVSRHFGCWCWRAACAAISFRRSIWTRSSRKKRQEHRSGFPDLMDLMVVCADAGLAMEASLDRIGRELGNSYPSLAANIHMANLEIRAGRTVTEALEHLGDRLGLEEARSFATLIQQSDELGSSISDALRVIPTTCATRDYRAPKRRLTPCRLSSRCR